MLESIGSLIEVDTRGSEIMRILPRINEEINEEWISDKTRYAFDGLKKQRITVPMLRDKQGNFKELSWEESFKIIADQMCSVYIGFYNIKIIQK